MSSDTPHVETLLETETGKQVRSDRRARPFVEAGVPPCRAEATMGCIGQPASGQPARGACGANSGGPRRHAWKSKAAAAAVSNNDDRYSMADAASAGSA